MGRRVKLSKQHKIGQPSIGNGIFNDLAQLHVFGLEFNVGTLCTLLDTQEG